MVKLVTDCVSKRVAVRKVWSRAGNRCSDENIRDRYINASANQTVYAYIEDDRPVGVMTLKELSDDTVELYMALVAEDKRRNGVGNALFKAVKEQAMGDGYAHICIRLPSSRLSIDEDNVSFIRSLGFVELGLLGAVDGFGERTFMMLLRY